MRRLLIIFALIFLSSSAYAQLSDKISPRQWANDLEVVQAELLIPLNEEMQDQVCPEDPTIFYQGFFAKLKTLRSKISSMSYLLIRDSLIGAAQSMGNFSSRIDCKKISQWEFFRVHVYNQIDIVGDMLTIIDVANED